MVRKSLPMVVFLSLVIVLAWVAWSAREKLALSAIERSYALGPYVTGVDTASADLARESSNHAGAVQGDVDWDGDVDLDDYVHLADCMGGANTVPTPTVTPVQTCLLTFDFDIDSDVDLFDWSAFQSAFTGALSIHPQFTPSPGQSDGEKTGTVGTVCHYIYPHSGEFTQSRTLLRLWGRAGLHWDLTITYRSGIIYDGPLGKGWTFNQDVRARELGDQGDVILYDGHGRQDTYAYTGEGQPYVSPPGSYDVLEKEPSGAFALTDRYGMVTRFDAAGLVESITHRTGNQILFERSPVTGRLLTVVDTLGREVTYLWDEAIGKLHGVTDPEGRSVTFGYNVDGQLETVTLPATPDHPAGCTWTYTYSSSKGDPRLDNLLTIEDAKGQVYLENVYDAEDRVMQQRFGPEAMISHLVYEPGRTAVTDQDGYVVDYEFDGRGLLHRTTTHTHGVRPGDPPAYVWEQVHDANAELILVTMPRGNSIEYVFDEPNPDPLQRGNLLAVRSVSHLPGEPSLSTTYSYEPLFNMVKTATDARGSTITCYYDHEEALLGDLNGDGSTSGAVGNVVLVEFPTVTLGQPVPQLIHQMFWYDANGNLIRQIEPSGEVVALEYASSGISEGMLRSVTRDYGGLNLTTEYGYNTRGDDLWVTDPGGNTTTTEVDAQGHVTRKIEPAPFNYETIYHYDANGNLVSEEVQNIDELGIPDPVMPWLVTTYTYDILDHMTSMTQEDIPLHSITSEFRYNVDGLLEWYQDPLGDVETRTYDERDLLYRHTRGVGSPVESWTSSVYDGNRSIVDFISHEGLVRIDTYDGHDRLVSHTDPEGNVVRTWYEGLELIAGITHFDAAGNLLRQREFQYDENGRLYQMDMPHLDSAGNLVGDGVATTTWQRDARGEPLIQSFDDGSRLRARYDGVGRLEESVRELSGGYEDIFTFQYDDRGNLIATTSALYNESTGVADHFHAQYAYDELGRVTREQHGSNPDEYSAHEYNSRSLRCVSWDGAGTLIRRTFDGLDREIEKTCELPIAHDIRATVWDDNGQPLVQYDANGNPTSFDFDALGRLTTVTYADGTQRVHFYDGDDRLIGRGRPSGTVEIILPNHAGYPQEIFIGPGPDVLGATQISYQYDGLNRLIAGQTTTELGPLTTNEWHYDTLSNLDREVQWMEGVATGPLEIVSRFDGVGNKTSLTYPDSWLVEFTADQAHRLKSIHAGGDMLASFDHVGRRLSGRQYLNGAFSQQNYDQQFRTSSLSHVLPAGTEFSFGYAHDLVGRKKYEQRSHDLKGDAYHYDALGALLGVKYGVPNLDPTLDYSMYEVFEGYSELEIDDQRNRIARDENGLLTMYNAPSGVYEPDPLNRVYWMNGMPRVHDAEGNLANNGLLGFSYNSRNQLSQVLPMDFRYLHDCIGRRVGAVYPDGSRRYFYFDREHCIEERDHLSAVLTQYVWGQELDDLVVLRRGGSRYFCHENDAGSICLVTDAAGLPVERINYDAYGRPLFFAWNPILETWDPVPQSTLDLAYLFMGQRYQAETGLYHFRTREYDPETGRYLQPDGELGPWQQYVNRYSFGDGLSDYVNHVAPYGTGGAIETHSWASGSSAPSEPYYEHINYAPSLHQVYLTQNKFSVHKKKKVKVDRIKKGAKKCRFGWVDLSGNRCTNANGISVRVERNGDTVEIYVNLDFTIHINTAKVCTKYKERDPKIRKKRKRQGKPYEVHITEGFIRGHEEVHVDQMMAIFDQTILEWAQKLDVKSKGFPDQLKKKLKKAYQQFKRDVARGYPRSKPEREARQKALEKWDRTRPKPKADGNPSSKVGHTTNDH